MTRDLTPQADVLDLRESGVRDGSPQFLDRRLFMKLCVLRCRSGHDFNESYAALKSALTASQLGTVLYFDVADANRVGVLQWSEEPAHFVEAGALAMRAPKNQAWKICPEFHMLGRTYSSGYEEDLEYWLLRRPVETVTNTKWNWAIWYPLRRSGAFEKLDAKEKGSIMREHAQIGKAYGEQDYAHDVRLACHGLDSADNDFVIGLCGSKLHPLSHIVQTMRRTRQTSEYIEKLGPFFVGRVQWRFQP